MKNYSYDIVDVINAGYWQKLSVCSDMRGTDIGNPVWTRKHSKVLWVYKLVDLREVPRK